MLLCMFKSILKTSSLKYGRINIKKKFIFVFIYQLYYQLGWFGGKKYVCLRFFHTNCKTLFYFSFAKSLFNFFIFFFNYVNYFSISEKEDPGVCLHWSLLFLCKHTPYDPLIVFQNCMGVCISIPVNSFFFFVMRYLIIVVLCTQVNFTCIS